MEITPKPHHSTLWKPILARPVSVTASSSSEDPMDITMQSNSQTQTSYNTLNPSLHQQEPIRRNERHENGAGADRYNTLGVPHMTGPQAQQARVVQTAFVQKLYNMLESEANQKAIQWSSTGDSFIVNPGLDFQNVLASYFKHTNPQSFVRQLNMYGFHKVNDVFQGSTPETHLWEFKHGEGNFRRGDVDGLREIKRRPSRHHLAAHHRENAQPPAQHVLPSVPLPTPGLNQDPIAARMEIMEQHIYDLHARLGREGESHVQSAAKMHQLQDKCQQLTESLAASQKSNRDMTTLILSILPDVNHPSHREALHLQSEIDRQVDQLRNHDMASSRHQSVASSTFEGHGAISPFALYDNDQRRGSLAQNSSYRQQHLSNPSSASPRRPGHLPGSFFPPPHGPLTTLPPPQAPQPQQPSTTTSTSPPAYLSRRHTSADVRENAGWKSAYSSSEHLPLPNINAASSSGQQSPYVSSNNSAQWPSSPHPRPSQGAEQLRESLGRYQIDSRNASTASDITVIQSQPSRRQSEQMNETTPTAAFAQPANSNGGPFGSLNEGSMFSSRPLFNSSIWGQGPNSASSTRRSSMAHILNPADTVERDEEDDVAPDDRGKRKRLE